MSIVRARAASPGASLRGRKSRDTKPELLLRRATHGLGLRYQVDALVEGSRRRSDLRFPTEKVAIFVDGCFWHGCPQHLVWPRNNAAWWREKLEGNIRREADTTQKLEATGWLVLRFWEHEDPQEAAEVIRRAVLGRRVTAPSGQRAASSTPASSPTP